MVKFVSNNREIYFHPQLFGVKYQELLNRVADLREKLSEAEFKTHATVKLFAAITVAYELIATELEAVDIMINLAQGNISQNELGSWLTRNSVVL